MSNKDKNVWLRWETEASIHHLFLTLEASMKPLRDWFGQSWPKTVLIYHGKKVIWSNKWKDVYSLGQKMIEFYNQKENEEKMWREWQEKSNKLNNFFSQLDKKK
ncbi:hypothetical protein HY405_01910, partial [Candidatus Microgenomates bacterium]|nr:hypothetical protein [Candidatus Microgenomates bacterium]